MDEKTLQLIRRIASVVGHELRNPMAVINNSAYFLKQKLSADGRLDPKVEKHLGIVTGEIARADRMIADLLAFPRPLELKPAPAALAPLIERELEVLEKPAGVAAKLKPCKLSAKVDAERFGEALRRQLENSVQALAGPGSITVSCAAAGEFVELAVEDAGPGFSEEALARGVEPFFTTKPKGLGLGLSIARKIALAHGGELAVENKKGGGARVVSRWPAA